MAAPLVEEESTLIWMVYKNWADDQVEQFSSVHRIGGYRWRLCIKYHDAIPSIRKIYLVCDKSSEAELWHCTATITSPNRNLSGILYPVTHMFNSWDKDSQKLYLDRIPHLIGRLVMINVAINVEESRLHYALRPTLGPFDRILVIGAEKKKIQVNTESLASQSSFFDRLFNGDFKEKNMSEIFIGDAEYEEFFNIIEMVYGSDGPPLTEENVHRFLELADRFDLKIVEDRVVSNLLSSSYFSIHNKLIMSEQLNNIPFFKDNLLNSYTIAQIIDLSNSTEFDQISHDSLQVLFKSIIRSILQNGTRYTSHISDLDTLEKNKTNTISMIVEDFGRKRGEQFSSVHRINGFPWRLRIENKRRRSNGTYDCYVYVICDKSNEAELWKCTAKISCRFRGRKPARVRTIFASWRESHEKCIRTDTKVRVGSVLEVTISTNDDGESYNRRSSLDPLEPRDGILVFENTEKKIEVNKKSLASQSPYFNSLFFGNFKEKDVNEFPIGDANLEEFENIMTLLYGFGDDTTINCNNAERILQLATRFELKLVEVRVVSFLISSSSSDISLPKKLRFADQFNLPLLKEFLLISQFKSVYQLKELSESPEWNQLSKEMLRFLFKFCVEENIYDDD